MKSIWLNIEERSRKLSRLGFVERNKQWRIKQETREKEKQKIRDYVMQSARDCV